ncbi:MAG: hypothetical protein ACI8PT_004301, partial [Gammaproteobacteria bacterium]
MVRRCSPDATAHGEGYVVKANDEISAQGASSTIANALAKNAGVLAIVLVLAFVTQGFAGNFLKSIGGDESGFIGGGYAMVKWRDYGYFNYIPPLMPALAALALLSKDIRLSDGTRPFI